MLVAIENFYQVPQDIHQITGHLYVTHEPIKKQHQKNSDNFDYNNRIQMRSSMFQFWAALTHILFGFAKSINKPVVNRFHISSSLFSQLIQF